MSSPRPSRPRGFQAGPAVEGLKDLWRDYHWPTKISVALLVFSCVVGAALAGWPSIEAGSSPAVRTFASDAFRTLLTLTIALFIAVNFYVRARRGILDGDEHYNVARALSFGYFKNFLVPALQLAARDGAMLQVFRPRTMDDLQRYSNLIEPRIRQRFEHEWLPLVEEPLPGGPPRRTVLVVRQPIDTRGVADHKAPPIFFDAPTALFTVQDFYAALNRRRHDDGKEPIDDRTRRRYQEGQIDSFFQHIDFLFTTDAGFEAVSDLVPTRAKLKTLRETLQYVVTDDLEGRFPAPTPGDA